MTNKPVTCDQFDRNLLSEGDDIMTLRLLVGIYGNGFQISFLTSDLKLCWHSYCSLQNTVKSLKRVVQDALEMWKTNEICDLEM